MNNTKQYAMDAEPISVIGQGNYFHLQTGYGVIEVHPCGKEMAIWIT